MGSEMCIRDRYETTRDQVRRALEGHGILLLTTDQGEGVMAVRGKIDKR